MGSIPPWPAEEAAAAPLMLSLGCCGQVLDLRPSMHVLTSIWIRPLHTLYDEPSSCHGFGLGQRLSCSAHAHVVSAWSVRVHCSGSGVQVANSVHPKAGDWHMAAWQRKTRWLSPAWLSLLSATLADWSPVTAQAGVQDGSGSPPVIVARLLCDAMQLSSACCIFLSLAFLDQMACSAIKPRPI